MNRIFATAKKTFAAALALLLILSASAMGDGIGDIDSIANAGGYAISDEGPAESSAALYFDDSDKVFTITWNIGSVSHSTKIDGDYVAARKVYLDMLAAYEWEEAAFSTHNKVFVSLNHISDPGFKHYTSLSKYSDVMTRYFEKKNIEDSCTPTPRPLYTHYESSHTTKIKSADSPTSTPAPMVEKTKTPKQTYVLNTNTKVFHYPECSSVSKMKNKNKKTTTSTREALINQGYKSCGKCNP